MRVTDKRKLICWHCVADWLFMRNRPVQDVVFYSVPESEPNGHGGWL